MKWNKLILVTLIAGGILVFQSCEKIENFGNMNSNPNATTAPNTAALLTNTLGGIGGTVWGGYPGSLTVDAGFYCQYFTESQYTETSRYQPASINWDGTYAGALYDLQNIILYNTSDPNAASANGDNANQIAIARILKAWYYWLLTDSYGDIPYSDALKGTGAIKYDDQSTIYPALITELKQAVAQFVNPSIAIKGDVLYGGDISKWKKFANSVRMLIALRMSRKNASLGNTEFNAALNDPAGVITVNSENASLVYPGGVFPNPIYNFYNIQQRFDVALCKTVFDVMGGSDNRRNVFGTSTVGFPYGLDRPAAVAFANANTNWARVAGNSTSPLVLVGAANVYLARAEAARLGWTAENASTMYATGVQRSWEQWGVYDATAFANWLAGNDLSSTPDKRIGEQTWLAWYPNGWQGWSAWRKTTPPPTPTIAAGYPALTPAPQTPVIPIPRRFPYGTNEPQLNPANYTPAAEKYKVGGVPNSQDARMWWDS